MLGGGKLDSCSRSAGLELHDSPEPTCPPTYQGPRVARFRLGIDVSHYQLPVFPNESMIREQNVCLSEVGYEREADPLLL